MLSLTGPAMEAIRALTGAASMLEGKALDAHVGESGIALQICAPE